MSWTLCTVIFGFYNGKQKEGWTSLSECEPKALLKCGSVVRSIYRKPRRTGQYIQISSFVPMSCKGGPAKEICSNIELKDELAFLDSVLDANGCSQTYTKKFGQMQTNSIKPVGPQKKPVLNQLSFKDDNVEQLIVVLLLHWTTLFQMLALRLCSKPHESPLQHSNHWCDCLQLLIVLKLYLIRVARALKLYPIVSLSTSIYTSAPWGQVANRSGYPLSSHLPVRRLVHGRWWRYMAQYLSATIEFNDHLPVVQWWHHHSNINFWPRCYVTLNELITPLT